MNDSSKLIINANNIHKRVGELLYKIYHTASNVDPLKEELDALDKIVFKIPEVPLKKKSIKKVLDEDEKISYLNLFELFNSGACSAKITGGFLDNIKEEKNDNFFDEAELSYLQEVLSDLEEDELKAAMTNTKLYEDKMLLLLDIKAVFEGDKRPIPLLKEAVIKDGASDIEKIREQLKIEPPTKKVKIERSL